MVVDHCAILAHISNGMKLKLSFVFHRSCALNIMFTTDFISIDPEKRRNRFTALIRIAGDSTIVQLVDCFATLLLQPSERFTIFISILQLTSLSKRTEIFPLLLKRRDTLALRGVLAETLSPLSRLLAWLRHAKCHNLGAEQLDLCLDCNYT